MMEDELKKLKYPSLTIFRPSLITGERKEKRAGEGIATVLMTVFRPLLIGPLKKYRPVAALSIAKAMLHYANEGIDETVNVHVISSETIKKFDC